LVQVIWSPRALADLEAIRVYIGSDSPVAGQRMAMRLKLAGDSSAYYPERGRQETRNVRETKVIYRYIVPYRVVVGRVDIARIKNGAQRPG
jgi:plasmid stabilization system protein ParE